MKFGLYPLAKCEGAILAHSLVVQSQKFRKGSKLSERDLTLLRSSGISELTVAKLEPGDVGEDEAAELVSDRIVELESSFFASAPFTGRVNIFASSPGMVEIDAEKVFQFNLVDQAITLATLPHQARVTKNQMIATIKIIPYGVSRTKVEEALTTLEDTIRFRLVKLKAADLILTTHSGTKASLVSKGRDAIHSRLQALGIELNSTTTVRHDKVELQESLRESEAPLVLVLTATATSDENDLGPEALREAGGNLVQVGIPVDPGNLLFYGRLGDQEVIGLPGCSRSIALNGADWVLERIACGVKLGRKEFAAMGAGGLLKEIPTRRQPRDSIKTVPSKPKVHVVVLTDDKNVDLEEQLTQLGKAQIEGISLVGNKVDSLVDHPRRDEKINIVEEATRLGKSSVVGASMASLPKDAEAVIFVRASQDTVTAQDINRLISGFSPEDGREIGKLNGLEVSPGPPILFGRRFFENLSNLAGGQKPSDLLEEGRGFVYEIAC